MGYHGGVWVSETDRDTWEELREKNEPYAISSALAQVAVCPFNHHTFCIDCKDHFDDSR